MKGLTEKQRRVFEFIRSQIVQSGRPPTIREIGGHFSMSSTGSVRDVLVALIKKGFIDRDSGVSRGIRIKVGPGPLTGNIVDLPVISRVAPGTTINAYQNFDKTLKIDKSMVPDGEIFVVKVKGEALAQAGIGGGDYAFVRLQPACRPDQIVAVLLGDKVVLREFSKKGDRIRLLPKGPKAKPVELKPEAFKEALLGVLVGVYRRF